MVHQPKIRQFVDRVRQCLHCYEFTHATRVCDRNICPLCGVNHEGLTVSRSEKCIHCTGPHPATSKSAHVISHEQKLLEFKLQKSFNYWRGAAHMLNHLKLITPMLLN
ncbi:hypothetical protein CDAR_186941 [Caerostris darwini]|uniref:Recombination activating protein 1 n=1 Tax=Caerostris darwini TaxID=1538125 RepID=A0AAV4PNU2_9ARAC|nr:hypothetical protein CDAR_186941 [Caerostris darwini]